MGRIDVLGWPLRTPNWVQTFLLIGLIAWIPILGGINTYGWMMTCVDNLRAGRTDLPPAGFYLGRGWRLAVVYLVYSVVPLGVLGVIIVFLLSGFGVTADGPSSTANGLTGLLVVLLVFIYGLMIAVAFILQGLLPMLGLATDMYGLGGALNPMVVIDWIRARAGRSLMAMLLSIAAQLIAGVGVYLCFIGVILSLPFGFAMLAGVIRNLELDVAEARS